MMEHGPWVVQDGTQNVSDFSDKFAPICMILDLQQKWAEQAPSLARPWTVDTDPQLNKVNRSEPCLFVKVSAPAPADAHSMIP